MQSATQADKEASSPESDALRKRKAWEEAHVMPAQWLRQVLAIVRREAAKSLYWTCITKAVSTIDLAWMLTQMIKKQQLGASLGSCWNWHSANSQVACPSFDTVVIMLFAEPININVYSAAP
jgi:hypothetical protein